MLLLLCLWDVATAQVMQAVCLAASQCLPSEQQQQLAGTLAQPVLAGLQQAVAQLPPHTSTPQDSVALSQQQPYITTLADRLHVLFDRSSSPAIAAALLGRFWMCI